MPSAVQVRHTADELGAGETAILTLADKGVLDEDDTDELENVLAVRCLPASRGTVMSL
jgi:hypothetical protein